MREEFLQKPGAFATRPHGEKGRGKTLASEGCGGQITAEPVRGRRSDDGKRGEGATANGVRVGTWEKVMMKGYDERL